MPAHAMPAASTSFVAPRRLSPAHARRASGSARARRAVAPRAEASSGAMDTLLGARIVSPDGDGAIRSSVTKYYGETLSTSDDLLTSACCTPASQIPRAVRDALSLVPDEVKAKYYGCGSPTPCGIEGLRVLDLGSGSGRDCYVAAKLVGDKGSVVGIDMTDGQLEVARRHADDYCRDALGYAETNVAFHKGTIEDLTRVTDAHGTVKKIENESVDLIISNCVVNLSPDKKAVLSEAHRVLADGGEFYFSDVYCDRRLPEDLRSHEILLGECLGGAMYIEDFKRLCHGVGFADPRVLAGHAVEIKDERLADLLGEAKFYSVTYRLFKLPAGRLETLCEDYGQFAVYKGTIEGNAHAYSLDDHHRLETGKPFLVCGNTAAMLGETWLGAHFEIYGDRSTHYGLFDCGPAPVAVSGGDAPANGGCC